MCVKGHSLHTRKIEFSQKKKWMEKILDIKIMQEEVFPKKAGSFEGKIALVKDTCLIK